MIPLWLLLSASFLSLTHLTPAPLPPATLNSKPQEGFFTHPPLCMHCYVCQGCWNQVFCFCLPQPHCPSSGAAPKIPLATHDLSNSLTAPGLKMDMWTLLTNQAWLEWLVEIGMDVYKPAGRIVKPWEGQRWSAKDLLWTPGSNHACSPTCRRHSHRQLQAGIPQLCCSRGKSKLPPFLVYINLREVSYWTELGHVPTSWGRGMPAILPEGHGYSEKDSSPEDGRRCWY